jgi:predicted nucleic acid-binding Zn finger protein
LLIEQQIGERRARASSAVARILERPAGGAYGDYKIKSGSGKIYRVAVRGPGLFENYCSCPDFAVNTLGTCKHIEAMLLRLRQRHRKTLETAAYRRTRASLSLQYGDTLEVRLHLPASPSPALRSLAAEYFDPAGLLPRTQYPQFAQVLEAFRTADDRAVVYSDALEYIEWENELADGLGL